MSRLVRLTFLACVAALAAVPLGGAAERMWVGFHDDPAFRWEEDRVTNLDRAAASNAGIVRAVVTWATVAPTRPGNAANPFDPTYRLNDLDEFVRAAQSRGMEVLLTIWGTPRWANGGQGPAYAPRNVNDLRNFARALSSRYSGRYAGYPFVRFYSVWNETNLQLFLAPQFDARGNSVAPRTYARMYAAAYAGIKAGSPRAQVAIGETSSNGRDKPLAGKSGTHSPGKFAELVAKANPRLKFDAWAHHPYPVPVNMKPTQKVKWPNVSLSSLPQFEQSLDKWFKRKGVKIWITEYGHETRPGEPKGVTEAQQAAFVGQALSIARKDARVGMFIWFVFQDTRTSLWQSGLYRLSGAVKPARSRFASAARPLDARNPFVTARAGSRPTVSLSVRDFGPNNRAGSQIGVNYRVVQGGRVVTLGQASSPLAVDGWIRFQVNYPIARRQTYTVRVEANDVHGLVVTRTITIRGV